MTLRQLAPAQSADWGLKATEVKRYYKVKDKSAASRLFESCRTRARVMIVRMAGVNILNITIRKILVLPLLIPFCAAAQSAPKPMDRDHSVLNAFQVMCNLESPDFSRIDAKATAMRMHVQSEASGPSANGTVTRHKVWVGGLTTGPFALLLDEMDGPKGTATACAIAAQVPDADAFRIATIDGLKLTSTSEQLDPTGAKQSEWRDVSGPHTDLVLRTIVKGETASVMVKLVSMHSR